MKKEKWRKDKEKICLACKAEKKYSGKSYLHTCFKYKDKRHTE